MIKTRTINQKEIEEKWYQVDATGMRVGHLATRVAEMLLDKGNPAMRDYLEPKVKVVVINAAKIDVPEKKRFNKLYTRYSGYPSGLTTDTMGDLMDKSPIKVVELAIRRMLPKNRRGRQIFTNLYVYDGAEHKHEAQKPEIIDIKEVRL